MVKFFFKLLVTYSKLRGKYESIHMNVIICVESTDQFSLIQYILQEHESITQIIPLYFVTIDYYFSSIQMIHSQFIESTSIQIYSGITTFSLYAVLLELRDVYMSHSGDFYCEFVVCEYLPFISQRAVLHTGVFRCRFIGLLVFIKFMHYLLFQPSIASKIFVMFC